MQHYCTLLVLDIVISSQQNWPAERDTFTVVFNSLLETTWDFDPFMYGSINRCIQVWFLCRSNSFVETVERSTFCRPNQSDFWLQSLWFWQVTERSTSQQRWDSKISNWWGAHSINDEGTRSVGNNSGQLNECSHQANSELRTSSQHPGHGVGPDCGWMRTVINVGWHGLV